jgi:hypothetical protein
MISLLTPRLRKLAVAIVALLLGVVPLLVAWGRAYAGELTQRAIYMNTSSPGTVTDHTFGFNIGTAGSLGSIAFEYCDNSPLSALPCNAPAGLNLTAATLDAQAGQSGFTIHPSTTANRMVITRPSTLALAVPASYTFGNVTNPSTPKQTIFVRISTYSASDGVTGRIDYGATVFSTSGALGAQGFVPPFLTFCVGVTVAPNCSSATGDFISFGELSTTATRVATLQFAVATNVDIGYAVSFLGTPLTSGNNVIPTPAGSTSTIGTSQFGFNLRANSNPSIGSDPSGPGTGVPKPPYNNANHFQLVDGDTVASSPLTTDFTRFTVSYIVNIAKTQPPGVYSTTNTYVATAQF